MAEQDQVIDSEELVEFKADGEDSSIADPVTTGSTKRKADKDQGDKAPLKMDTKNGPKMSKAQLINAMVGKQYESLAKMTASDLRDMYSAQSDTSNSRKADKSNGMAMMKLSVKEDVAEIFGSEQLSEEFMEKAETIFEAAVAAKITTEVARLEEEYEAKLEEAVAANVEEIASQVDEYLSYAVKEWAEENRLAIESGIRAEIAESFMTSLKAAFEDHYIELPEEKVDVVAELQAKVEELEADLNEQIEKNFEVKKHYTALERHVVFEEISEGLAATQVEKLQKLAGGIDADSVEEYKEKLFVVRETYFPTEKVVMTEEVDEVDVDDDDVQEVHGEMAAYVNALSRSMKNK